MSPTEQVILEDIRQKTGYSFVRIEGIPTRNREMAELVLPVLRDWVPLVTESSLRGGIFHQFVTPHAHPFIDSLIQWWLGEPDRLNVVFLTHALATVAKPEDGERLWQLCKEQPPESRNYMLLAKLATLPSVERDVKALLAEALERSTLKLGDLQHIADVDDPRIRRWFEERTTSPDRRLRQLARKVVERGKKLPRGVVLAASPPDRTAELFSTEADLEHVPRLLRQLSEDLRLRIPSGIRNAAFLSRLELDRWAVVSEVTANGAPANLWFRMEDVDAVEVVVTTNSPVVS